MSDEFSVYWWDAAGLEHTELRLVGPDEAVRAVKRLTTGPAAQHGMVSRVIITDGGDFCNFEWRDGRITYDGNELPEAPRSIRTRSRHAIAWCKALPATGIGSGLQNKCRKLPK